MKTENLSAVMLMAVFLSYANTVSAEDGDPDKMPTIWAAIRGKKLDPGRQLCERNGWSDFANFKSWLKSSENFLGRLRVLSLNETSDMVEVIYEDYFLNCKVLEVQFKYKEACIKYGRMKGIIN